MAKYSGTKITKTIFVFAIVVFSFILLPGCSSRMKDQKIPVKILILPKFEVGELTGDFPGEAQYFYEAYVADGDVYDIEGSTSAAKLYYKDGVAICLLGQGKTNAAINTAAVLSDKRFDFSEAYILGVGCGGTAEGYGIFGDVFVVSTAVDCDLGHWVDSRELNNQTGTTWFHDKTLDDYAVVQLDQSLTNRVFELVKDLKLETTENTVKFLQKEYAGEAWADRAPKVMRGTTLTSDRYWKGTYNHQNALLIAETYHCQDPYAVTEMEDIAVARAAESFGLADRLIILRTAVNMDVFPTGMTPEMLWRSDDYIASEASLESVDIFETAMHNCFEAGKVLIDAILEGAL